MDWKETVISMSDHVFPGISHRVDFGKNVLTNLPLQMALYFNAIFAPVWVTVFVLYLTENYNLYDELYKFIIITIITTVFLVEILRLYLGYEGNLQDRVSVLGMKLYRVNSFNLKQPQMLVEQLNQYYCRVRKDYEYILLQIPELAGFWMLTLLLQFPLQGFLLFNPYFGLHILELVVQGVMFTMLCLQLLTGYCALRYTATQQTIYFTSGKVIGTPLIGDNKNPTE
ncbi:hypothetical protein NQ317_007050 [Molorchus minor]|uniref:Uncharacterized protein n=1 Tax=Molorchus minor TaxID=1323400 RepID=A0ABQ9K6V9_9CUCU|nr:hypothetical protein NQ317_007050 [Molorchus minor]